MIFQQCTKLKPAKSLVNKIVELGMGGCGAPIVPPPYPPDEPEKAFFESSCELQKSNGKLYKVITVKNCP